MSFTYRGLRKFNQFDIGTTWVSVDEINTFLQQSQL